VTAPDLSELSAFFQQHGIGVLGLLILAIVAFRLVRPIVHRSLIRILKRRAASGADEELDVAEADKRAATLEDLISTILRLTVVLVTVLVLLTWFDLLPVIAGLGVLAAAITLAGQSIVLDYLMGFLIVVEGPYNKGDWIQVGGVEGEVEEIGLRRTTLRDTSGTVHSVSNGEIRISSNLTRIFARMQVDMTVAFGTDLDAVTRIVNEVGAEMAAEPEWKDRLLETPTLTRVPALGDLGITVRVAGKVRPTDRWTAPSELRKRLIVAFQANGIEIPVRAQFPVGASGGSGSAPTGPAG
jgi:moderate conductance mechanosensitive channel